jgi:xanthosine utilization system XapX-like protein
MTRVPRKPDVIDAWHMVSLVVEWTKHADMKAGATLTGAGVLGGLLYALVGKVHRPAPIFVAAATACALSLIGTAVAAIVAVSPRVQGGSQAIQAPLFCVDIAERFPDSPAYAIEFQALTRDRQMLHVALSDLIWNSATIAAHKYRVVKWATRGLALSVISLAVTAIVSTSA